MSGDSLLTKTPPKGWLKLIFGFLLGAIATNVFDILVFPIHDRLLDAYKSYVAPVKVEFIARPDVQCEAGDIHAVIEAAADELLDGRTIPERLASRAFVCANFTVPERPPIQTLNQLSQRYPHCFVFTAAAAPPEGGAVKARFQLSLGKGSHICVAPLGKNPDTNLWETKSSLEDGRVYCLGDREPAGLISNLSEPVRLCAIDDLKAFGFGDILTKVNYGAALTKFAR